MVTRDGEVHVIRKDTKTEFECSRQGYFRHPSGCNRFYRCVKFDQKSNYFTVYEYDCPDGLAFDEKVEVCVWPGSLSNTGACQGIIQQYYKIKYYYFNLDGFSLHFFFFFCSLKCLKTNILTV